jgi:S1-C subfamily serine protease
MPINPFKPFTLMKPALILMLACLLPGVLPAQQDIPLLRPEEIAAADAQSDEFNAALLPLLTTAAKSTVRVWSGERRLAYGTVVADGRQVLTKYSELARAIGRDLIVEAGDGQARPAQVTGVYQDEDLALLTIEGEPLPPVQWASDLPKLGSFLTATQPGGKPAAFGVVGVLQRSLRETDKAFLGVQGDIDFAGPGVRVVEVTPNSGAAAAGLQPGDIIETINQRPLSGVLELRASLTGVEPGTTIAMTVNRNGQELKLNVTLKNRPNSPQFSGARIQAMRQMGTQISRGENSFSDVIQSDMRPNPDQIGGPVVDLKGRVVGITMARADRTRSFIMPSAAVVKLLSAKPTDPALVRAAPAAPRLGPGGMRQGIAPDRMRRHSEDSRRLMEQIQEQLEELQELEGLNR